MTHASATTTITIGLDLGDRYTHFCELDGDTGVLAEGRFRTTAEGFRAQLGGRERLRVVLEVGTHSPWSSRLLEELGHEVVVANPHRVSLIAKNNTKSDRVDAELLARLGHYDPKLLHPIRHRGEQAQADLARLRARDCLVRVRTKLVNHVRGAVKSIGGRLPPTSTASFARKVSEEIPEVLRDALMPLLEMIQTLSDQISAADRSLETLAQQRYPDSTALRQINGVGPLTSLAYVLVLEDPSRFAGARSVGAYVGLCPRRSDSGDSSPQLRITKSGDPFLRRLLVQSAQYMLGPFGQDSELRRWGLKLAERGGKNAKKRAVVAVARKLSVLLYRLWVTQETYRPLRHAPA